MIAPRNLSNGFSTFQQYALTVILLLSFLSCSNGDKGGEIKIGVILPLTGKYSVIGEGEKKGFDLALGDLRKRYPNIVFTLIYEDFGSDTKNAITAAKKLIHSDGVAAIITSTTAACEAVAPITDSQGVVHFVISPDPAIVSNYHFNFRIYYNYLLEANEIETRAKELGAHSISILGSSYSSIEKLITDDVIPRMKNQGIQVDAVEFVSTDAADIRTPILKVKSAASDLLFLAPMTNQVKMFTDQLLSYDVKPSGSTHVLGSFTYNWQPAQYIATLEGYEIISPAYSGQSAQDEFKNKFNAVYGINPTFDMAYAYDNLTILSNLLLQDSTPQGFAKRFNSLGSVNGVSGKIDFVGGNETSVALAILTVSNDSLHFRNSESRER